MGAQTPTAESAMLTGIRGRAGPGGGGEGLSGKAGGRMPPASRGPSALSVLMRPWADTGRQSR